MKCAACGQQWRETMYLDRAKVLYGDKVYQDFKDRGYKDYNNICVECLDECESSLSPAQETE